MNIMLQILLVENLVVDAGAMYMVIVKKITLTTLEEVLQEVEMVKLM